MPGRSLLSSPARALKASIERGLTCPHFSDVAAGASARTRFLASLLHARAEKGSLADHPRSDASTPTDKRAPASSRPRICELHRHEEIESPAYDTWLSRTFPVWVTTLRKLYAEVSRKNHQVQTVIFMAEITGRSLKKLWRE